MIKIILVIFFTLTSSCLSLLLKKNIQDILLRALVKISDADMPKRVRTVEELERRKGECVALDFIGIVDQYGYTAEEYNVTTPDGYILTIHRVSGSPSSPKGDGKPVVFMNHGLLTDSDFYVLGGPDRDLVYLMTDKGYDVWVGNVRGTSYSRSHVNYSHSDPEFWNFSLDEQALIDTPTFIDFILKETGQEKLTYIGYSMGTTESYMLLSSKPEYNEKVNLLISIAPVVYFSPPINGALKALIKIVTETAKKIAMFEVLPQACMIGTVGDIFCSAPEPNLCCPFVNMFGQSDKMNISYNLPKYMKHFPAGVCYHAIEHYNQMIEAGGKFQKYDFSYKQPKKTLNIEKYNQSEPPAYNVALVTAPAALFCSSNDIFVPLKNARLLKKNLPNVVVFNIVSEKKFNHLDFFWHLKAKELVYYSLIDILPRQEEKKVEIN